MYLIIILAIVSTCDGLTYRNYALLHGIPQNDRELKFFHDMKKLYNVTFWRRPSKVNGPVEFTVSPRGYEDLMYDTYPTKIRFRTIMDDVQSAFDKEIIKRYIKHHLDSFSWNSYHGLDDIYNWMKDLSVAYSNYIELVHIGKSLENRDIFAVKLKLNNAITCKDRSRPKVIVEGGSHGREWISPAVVTFMIHALLQANKSNSMELKLVAPMYDWIFVPVMNPDGYVYSQTTDRLWHKNRRDGHGVDLDRNFGVVFGRDAAKKKEDEEYCGKAPFSEPETTAMATLARDNSGSLEYYLSFHSYGQYILIPYSFSKMHEDNYSRTKIVDMVADKIYTKYGVQYEVGTSYDTQGYLASGVSADWAKRALNATHVATFMLPDAGEYGYALPTDQILPICQATMDGLLALLDPPNPDLPREPRAVDDTDPFDEDDPEDPEDPDGTQEINASKLTFVVINVVVYVIADLIRE